MNIDKPTWTFPGIPNLKGLKVTTIRDLLNYFPRDWVITPPVSPIAMATIGETITVSGFISSVQVISQARPARILARLDDGDSEISLVWFNQVYLRNYLKRGTFVVVTGRVREWKGKAQLCNPKFVVTEPGTDLSKGFNGGVYPATEEFPSAKIGRYVQKLLGRNDVRVPEYLDIHSPYSKRLIDRHLAYEYIHKPGDKKQLDRAKLRLKFDELFFLQLGLALKRRERTHCVDAPVMTDKAYVHPQFPFPLTKSQHEAIADIITDMSTPNKLMNRLLHGDVGYGKTAVAIAAISMAVHNSHQVAIMAPTQILADQLATAIGRYNLSFNGCAECITGAVTKKRVIKSDVVIGTTSLLSNKIEMPRLGLIIVDEQHKFGVEQKIALARNKPVHKLVMSATPIPRTMAMTIFGDMDVSVLKTPPANRATVVTRVVPEAKHDKMVRFVNAAIDVGRQVYVIYPRIETLEKARKEGMKLAGENVYIHGNMEPKDIYSRLQGFRDGTANVLHSTSIVEVGVDIPNASVMVIVDAEMFGVAQLHQLRGRIGRGGRVSTCFLRSDSFDPGAIQRLNVLTKTTDGFDIAEYDLASRGPGSFFDIAQHGLPNLRLANIVDDYLVLMEARHLADKIVDAGPIPGKLEYEMKIALRGV